MKAQLSIDLHGELIVDNFAGGGGASTGIELALGRSPDIAVNHCREALAMHQANHPETRHYQESVWTVDIAAVCGGRPVGLLWLSPDCKHFSKAKGAKPRNKHIRGLAWVALKWVHVCRNEHGRSPRVILLENVEEFQTWGPVGADGIMKPENAGKTFRSFVGALRRRGYEVEWRELRACDYGAPTIRKRLFLIARNDGRPIVWPTPTHGPGRPTPYRTAAECIDWTIPAPSIFERARPLADATCRRIAKGIMRYVVNSADPFIVPLTHQGGDRVNSIREPLRTVTGAHRGELALVSPVLTEISNASNPRCMPADEPLRTICAETKGGHHALVTAFLAKHYGGHETPGWPLSKPLSTITATDHHSLVSATLMRQFGTSNAADIEAPLGTVMAQGAGKTGLVEAFLIKYYGNEADGVACDEPMHTVTARDRFGLVHVKGEQYLISDIGLRMLVPSELFKAQGFPPDYIIDWGFFQEGRELIRKPITKTAQVRMCGNSVCPSIAAAIVGANCADLAVRRAA